MSTTGEDRYWDKLYDEQYGSEDQECPECDKGFMVHEGDKHSWSAHCSECDYAYAGDNLP